MTSTTRRRFDRSRLRLGLVLAVIAGAIAFLLAQGLGNATTYFLNADEVVARGSSIAGQRIRLQGTVVEGSVSQVDDRVEFVVEYHCETVPVSHEGDPPELFQAGIPVVVEGELDGQGTFRSDRILVNHTNEYETDEAGRLEDAEQEACP